MFRAHGVAGDGRLILIVGLSARNLERLQQGNPIALDTAEMTVAGVPMGRPFEILMLFTGETEASMEAEILRGAAALGIQVSAAAPGPELVS